MKCIGRTKRKRFWCIQPQTTQRYRCNHVVCFCMRQVLADQDWISFRPNVFALQDLASKWMETIKARLAEAQRADTVTEHVHQV